MKTAAVDSTDNCRLNTRLESRFPPRRDGMNHGCVDPDVRVTVKVPAGSGSEFQWHLKPASGTPGSSSLVRYNKTHLFGHSLSASELCN